jgi:2-C-methyl-D-erythritol 4-phosphate cytidylyltransferase
MPVSNPSGFVAVVPAGGSGSRMGAGVPKQYRLLRGEPVIAHTLNALLAQRWIDAVHVVVATNDTFWQDDQRLADLTARHSGRLNWHNVGGATRQDTVLAGLMQVSQPNPWVMVHDAARPGIGSDELHALRAAVQENGVGALLATRVADTVKLESETQTGFVSSTTPRDRLWLAQTPQVFGLQALITVLRQAQEAGNAFTDEASAMEASGCFAQLVPGSWRNFKLTTAPDIERAEITLSHLKPLDYGSLSS